ncbi:MAG: hypothetical protein L0Y80_08590 [Ignavibacteriae bacterium]|nr:hypothetical protein [Ignavibacteriota bacterium]
MKTLTVLTLVLFEGTVQNSPVQVIGTYSDVHVTEEHAYGTEVELWRSGASEFGMLYLHEGMMGDAPRGLLERVEHDLQSKKFSFSAKLTKGLHYCSKHQNVPSREFVAFSGYLYPDSLVGTLTVIDSLDAKTVSSERVSLRKSTERTAQQEEQKFQSLAEWTTHYWEAIHKPRGPKW